MDFIHTSGKRNAGQAHAAQVVAVGTAAAAEQFKRQAEFFGCFLYKYNAKVIFADAHCGRTFFNINFNLSAACFNSFGKSFFGIVN